MQRIIRTGIPVPLLALRIRPLLFLIKGSQWKRRLSCFEVLEIMFGETTV